MQSTQDQCIKIFRLEMLKNERLIAYCEVFRHPLDKTGGELHFEVMPEYRKNWLTKNLAKEMLDVFISTAKKHNLETIYSTALTTISPKLLEFFGFTEYYKRIPKTYYYMKI